MAEQKKQEKKLHTHVQIQKFDTVPNFTDAQLRRITEMRADFLKKIYPFLRDDEYQDGCIELRPLWRGGKIKHAYIKSFNAWHMTASDVDNLYKFGKLVNGMPYCMYYSVYAFDYQKKVINKSKTEETSKTVYRHQYEINEENAMFTTILVSDFDNVDFMSYKNIKGKLMTAGIETVDVWTGHGFQIIVLLDRKYYDLELLGKFQKVMQCKGFPVDESIKNASRVCRMPYFFNCKELEKDFQNGKVINTFIVADTDRRYSVVELFTLLQKMSDVIPPSKEVAEPAQVMLHLQAIRTAPLVSAPPKKKKEIGKIEFRDVAAEYPIADFARLPEAIKKILSGTPDGLRDATTKFLIPFFKNAEKMSLEQTQKIMAIWNQHCQPPEDQAELQAKVKRLYLEFRSKKKFGTYTAEMQKVYGPMVFDQYRLNNTILIPNTFLNRMYAISDRAVQIYLAMLLCNKQEQKQEWTAQEVCTLAKINMATLYRNIDILCILGVLSKKRGYKKGKEEYTYKINAYIYCLGTKGYTKVETSFVELMLLKLRNGEIKTYIFLRYFILASGKDICTASQKWIGEKVGKKQNTITDITTALTAKKYIRKDTRMEGIVPHCTYTLLK